MMRNLKQRFEDLKNDLNKEFETLYSQNDVLNERLLKKNDEIDECRKASGKLYINFDRQRRRVKSLYKMLDRTNLSKLKHEDAIKLLKNVKHVMQDITYSYSNEGD